MWFKKKVLPKPFEESLIKSLKEIDQIAKLEPSNKLKNFNFIGVLALSDHNFSDLSQMIKNMDILSIWYEFLTNFDEKNQIKDFIIHLQSIEKILGKPEAIVKNLADLVRNVQDISTHGLVVKYGPNYKSLLKNNDIILIKFKKEIEKKYRTLHKDTSKQLRRIRSKFQH